MQLRRASILNFPSQSRVLWCFERAGKFFIIDAPGCGMWSSFTVHSTISFQKYSLPGRPRRVGSISKDYFQRSSWWKTDSGLTFVYDPRNFNSWPWKSNFICVKRSIGTSADWFSTTSGVPQIHFDFSFDIFHCFHSLGKFLWIIFTLFLLFPTNECVFCDAAENLSPSLRENTFCAN